MSIIYKALQKTQRKREHENHPPIHQQGELLHHRSHWIDAVLMLIIAVLLGIVILAYYPRINLHAKPVPPPVIPHQPSPEALKAIAFKSKYVLNGIFVSDKNIIAMINNQYFHLGDFVGDMKIIAITDKSVKLKDANQVIELEVPI